MKYRAVIFDLWQTLVPWDVLAATRFYDEMAVAAGVDEERFREAWVGQRKDREVRPIADHLRDLFSGLGAEPDLDEVLAMRREWTKRSLQPRPDALETLAELRGRGHKLGLISVCSQDVPHVWDETALDEQLGELGVLGRDADVGIQRKLHAPADGRAVHRRDHRLGAI